MVRSRASSSSLGRAQAQEHTRTAEPRSNEAAKVDLSALREAGLDPQVDAPGLTNEARSSLQDWASGALGDAAQAAVDDGLFDDLDDGPMASLAQPGAGEPLEPNLQVAFEEGLGTSLDDVQVHKDEPAVAALDGSAAALGSHVFFAPGAYDPDSRRGRRLLAEELAHVKQTAGRAPSGPPRLGATSSTHERQAQADAAALVDGRPASNASSGSADASVIRRGEAGVHQGIELTASATKKPGLLEHPRKKDSSLSARQKKALQMYAGNWMRDFSQLNAPMVVGSLGKLSSDLTNPKAGKPIGASGGESLMMGIVKALAIMELGNDAATLVTPKSLGAYQPQEHIDNPRGNTGGDFNVRDRKTGTLRAATDPTVGSTPASSSDADTNAQLAGKSVPGLQFGNHKLYETSPTGLSNHIYNSVEWAKGEFMQAARAGEGPKGRMHLGSGLHVVEDYYAHSNFIEVALNRYIDDALMCRQHQTTGAVTDKASLVQAVQRKGKTQGQWVHSLFDKEVVGPGGHKRHAITTGSFGGADTKVSLAHLVLPMVPKLEAGITAKIDTLFGNLRAVDKPPKDWKGILKLLGDDRPTQALNAVAKAADKAGLVLTTPYDWKLTWGQLPISPGIFGKPWTVSVPTGVGLASRQLPLTQAIGQSAGLIRSAHDMIETLKGYGRILPVGPLVKQVKSMLNGALKEQQAAIKQMLGQALKRVVASIAGMDPAEASKSELGALVHQAQDKMHSLEQATSLKSRLSSAPNAALGTGDLYDRSRGQVRGKDGKLTRMSKEQLAKARAALERTLGPLKGEGTPSDPWVPVSPLPPSHSEIGKDHPGHAAHGHGHGHKKAGKKVVGRSPFYGLHRALAVEADRHLMKQMEQVWKQPLFGKDGQVPSATVNSKQAIDAAASRRGTAEAARAKKQGFKHAQSDPANAALLTSNPAVKGMLDKTDLFIAHPHDSGWWSGVFDGYVAKNAQEVYEHILARNRTAKDRK